MKILLVEDDDGDRKAITHVLQQAGHEVVSHANAEDVLSQPEAWVRSFDFAVLDWQLPRKNGLELGQTLFWQNPRLFLIMLTAYGTLEREMEARRYGGFIHFIRKPGPDDLLEAINLLGREVKQRRDMFEKLGDADYGIVGSSPAMVRVRELITTVAPTDVTVLISGETGTGKELVARAIHGHSRRNNGPFITLDCSTLAKELAESELFGHEEGAFSGAVSQHRGRFERADTGTLFLDEVANLPMEMQAKLLRVIEAHSFERVGGEKMITTDVRVIAATNEPLDELIALRRFRRDLFYRLNVVQIPLPPLRERGEDILLLAHHFLNQSNARLKKTIQGFSEAASQEILRCGWPGNVRELENAIKKTVIVEKTSIILPSSLPDLQPTAATGDGSANNPLLSNCSAERGGENPQTVAASSRIASSKEENLNRVWKDRIAEELDKLEAAFPEAQRISQEHGKEKVRYEDLGKALGCTHVTVSNFFNDQKPWQKIPGRARRALIQELAKEPARWPGLRSERSPAAKYFRA